jgi:hypothetical protein
MNEAATNYLIGDYFLEIRRRLRETQSMSQVAGHMSQVLNKRRLNGDSRKLRKLPTPWVCTKGGKEPMTRRIIVVLILLAGLLIAGLSQASNTIVETQYLIVSDATNKLSDARLKSLADQTQTMLEYILAFWSVDSGISQLGKIRVIFDAPRRLDYYTSVVDLAYKEDGRRVRTVRVFGAERSPLEVVHKLTQAIFLREDKLIRNMIGVSTEEKLGNPLSFPGCGFSSDDWVLAFLKTKTFIPLNELGPDHESWGMKVGADGFPSVFDRARQSTAYAEVGSFGSYLIRTYGINKIKHFYELSGRKQRPWKDVFGIDIQELEANWLKTLQVDGKIKDENVSILSKLFEKDPNTACLVAQKLVSRK